MTTVLDPKRSNAINIGLTTLPPVHVIKAALLNFDEFAVSKDGIEVGMPNGCEREVGDLVFLTFPVPLVVGMGLSFLQGICQTLGLSQISQMTRGVRASA